MIKLTTFGDNRNIRECIGHNGIKTIKMKILIRISHEIILNKTFQIIFRNHFVVKLAYFCEDILNKTAKNSTKSSALHWSNG